MAISVTSHFGSSQNGGNSFVSSSFTPANSSLIVVCYNSEDDGGATYDANTPTISSSAGLSWTSRLAVTGTTPNGGPFRHFTRVWTAPVTTGTSMTVTVTSGYATNHAMSVVSITGHNASSPIGLTGTASGIDRSGALSLSLGGTTAAGSVVIGSVGINGQSTVVGTGWTQLLDENQGSWFWVTDQYKAGALSSCDWDTVTCDWSWSAAALEIVADGPAATSRPLFPRPFRPFNRS